MNLKNNTILITGGTSGLGLEFTRHLLALNNTVIVTGRNQTRLDEIKKRFPDVHTFQSDVSEPASISELHQKVITQFPNLNMLINNAGVMRKINLHDPSNYLENITTEIETNLMGPIRMIQQFLPHFKKQKNAVIVNVTSALALIPFPISPIYGATKSGLRSYTKSLRVQLKNTSIKVFELIPPATKTPLNDEFASDVDIKSLMDTGKLVAIALKGLENDTLEIYPGLANVLRIMSRLAPAYFLKQLSKPVDKMLNS